MSTEIIEKINPDNVRHMLTLSCAPLLAGLKTASLFVTEQSNYNEVCGMLRGSEVEIVILARRSGMLTLLLFDRRKLSECLKVSKNILFMRKLGYPGTDVDEVLSELSVRYRLYLDSGLDFPHEMGIVLGIPLEDVSGFMCNNGQNYLMSGYWKVYGKLSAARKIFKAYDDATERMITELVG